MMLKQAVRVRQIIGQRDLILWFRLGNVPFLYKKKKKGKKEACLQANIRLQHLVILN